MSPAPEPTTSATPLAPKPPTLKSDVGAEPEYTPPSSVMTEEERFIEQVTRQQIEGSFESELIRQNDLPSGCERQIEIEEKDEKGRVTTKLVPAFFFRWLPWNHPKTSGWKLVTRRMPDFRKIPKNLCRPNGSVRRGDNYLFFLERDVYLTKFGKNSPSWRNVEERAKKLYGYKEALGDKSELRMTVNRAASKDD